MIPMTAMQRIPIVYSTFVTIPLEPPRKQVLVYLCFLCIDMFRGKLLPIAESAWKSRCLLQSLTMHSGVKCSGTFLSFCILQLVSQFSRFPANIKTLQILFLLPKHPSLTVFLAFVHHCYFQFKPWLSQWIA